MKGFFKRILGVFGNGFLSAVTSWFGILLIILVGAGIGGANGVIILLTIGVLRGLRHVHKEIKKGGS